MLLHCLCVQYIWILLHMRKISRFFYYRFICVHCVCRTFNVALWLHIYVDFSNYTFNRVWLECYSSYTYILRSRHKTRIYSEWRKGGAPTLNLNVYAWLGNYYFNRTRLFSNIIIIVTPWLCHSKCNIARITFAFSLKCVYYYAANIWLEWFCGK